MRTLTSALCLALTLPLVLPAPAGAASRAMEIVKTAPISAWDDVPDDRLLVMTLDGGAVIAIVLAPDFARIHVGNIVAMARAHRWDRGAITRVQENFVAQWAPRDEKIPMPARVVAHPPAEYERSRQGVAWTPLGFPDAYAPQAGFVGGMPAGSDGARVWLAHCYAMVGVARDNPPDTGTGEELYVVNGQAPRQLDRNLTIVGRVVDGMQTFGSLPRGTGDLGFYKNDAQKTGIRSIMLAADMPQATRPHWQIMRSQSASFAQWLDASANRTEPFYVHPAHGLALCNAPVPARPRPATADRDR